MPAAAVVAAVNVKLKRSIAKHGVLSSVLCLMLTRKAPFGGAGLNVGCSG